MKYIKDIFLCMILILVLWFAKDTLQYTKEALTLWFEKLVPSMFVTLVCIRIIYHRRILEYIRIPFISRLFHIDQGTLSLILCTMFLGFPNGALFVDEAYHSGTLDEAGAKRVLYTCSFAAPGFVVMTCGALLFQSVRIGVYLFVAQILSGMVLLLVTRKHPIYSTSSTSPSIPLSKSITTSILESGKALYMIGGYMMLFMSISGVLLHFLPSFLALPLRIICEFSSGVVLLQKLPLSTITLQLLTCMLLSFGGLCVHMQVKSIAEHIPFSYFKYLSYRIVQSILSMLIFSLFLL
ncbi:MAG: hypothetical protein RR531_02030 [Longicatena sp.]